MNQITVVGAGLAGSLMANYLAGTGNEVSVYERNADRRHQLVPRGRSINLALSHRGISALQGVGLGEKLLEIAIPMRGRMMHDALGKCSFMPYGTEEHHAIQSISRNELNTVLLDEAQRRGARLFFQHRCSGVDLDKGSLSFIDQTGNGEIAIRLDRVVAADGAFSAVRGALVERLRPFDFHQSFLEHGYKELTIPAAPDGSFVLPKNCLHIWPRSDYMLIALPNLDGSFTCTLFFPLNGPISFESLKTDRQVSEFFERNFPDALPLIPDLFSDFFENPTGTLVTVRCLPWHVEDKIVLIGDAAHAVVPFYGQGMNAAFEDCLVLSEILGDTGGDWRVALPRFQARRKEDADTLADLAIGNYLEMRSKVASRSFLVKKWIERTLAKIFPRRFLPLYTMVTFTRIGYAEAVRIARKQDKNLRIVAAGFLILVLAVVLGWMWTSN